MAKSKGLIIISIGLIGAVVTGLILQQRSQPQHSPTMSRIDNSDRIITRTRVWIGSRFDEAFTYADVKFVNQTNFQWKVKRVIYSCCGNTEKYYRWTPDVTPPGRTLLVHARLELPRLAEKEAERPLRDTFWIEVETDGHPKRGFLVADIEGLQKNCLPDAPLYLNLQSSKEVIYRFHSELDLRGIKVTSTSPSLVASVDYNRKALRLKCAQTNYDYSGKILVYDKERLLRTIHVKVSPPFRLWVTPRFLGFGVLRSNKSTTKGIKIASNNPNKIGHRVQLLTSAVPAGEFRLVSAKQEGNSVLLVIEFLPQKAGHHYGTLRLKIYDTVLDIPWSCEVVSGV